MRSNEIDQLAAALVAAQAEFEAVEKTADNPHFRSKFAPLPEVVKAATPIITKHGLAVSQHVVNDGLMTMLLHSSGQFIESTMNLHIVPDREGRLTPQAQGAAVTYARRQAYMAVLGLVADDDDDGNAASGIASPKEPTPALGAMTRRRAPTGAATGTPTSSVSATAPEPPPEARISAADAKRELIDHAVSLGWDPTDAKSRAKEAWGDHGTDGLLRGLLETLKMQIEKAPGQ